MLTLVVLAAHDLFIRLPNRIELGPRPAELQIRPVALDGAGFAPLHLVGAWRMTSDDPRFGGVSGLAVDGGELVALTDSGVVIRLPKSSAGQPAISARIAELPGGPGPRQFKWTRDAEALAADPAGRGWWVAFENRDQLWLYDRPFRRPLRRIVLNGARWPFNRGIEGLAVTQSGLWLLPEAAGRLIHVHDSEARSYPIAGLGGRYPWQGWVTEAVALPGGRLLLAERRLTPAGYANALLLLERAGGAVRIARRYPLPVGRLDNIEAVAAEPAPGGTRLWLMSDNDGQGFADTLLLELLAPESALRPRRRSR